MMADESGLLGYIALVSARWNRPGLFNPYQFLLDHGRSQQVVGSKRKLRANACVNNSIKMIVDQFRYIEGYVVVHIPLQHAWNEAVDTGQWMDHTIRSPECWEYFGVEIPTPVILLAARHKMWTLSTGVLETMCHFPDEDLIWAEKQFSEALGFRAQGLPSTDDPVNIPTSQNLIASTV